MRPLDLSHFPQPETNDPGSVEAALEALWMADDESTAVRKKLDGYRFYVTSGQVWQNDAGNSQLPVVLTVVVTGQMTFESEVALKSLRPAYDAAPTSFAYLHMPKPEIRR